MLSLRLLTYVLIAGIVLFRALYSGFLSFPFFAYSLTTLCLPIMIILKRWYNPTFLFKGISALQTFFEIVAVLGIIYATGNINSTYSGLLVLTVISASLVYSLAGTLLTASVVSLGYAVVVWFGFGGIERGLSGHALETIFSSQDAAFYNIFLHILTFYLVAFVAGFLMEKLKSSDQELEDTSQALRKARLETDDILRHLNSGLMTIDSEGRIIFYNRAAEEILGYRESEVKGRIFRDLFSSQMPFLAENLAEVLQSGRQSRRCEINIERNDGTRIPLGISTSLLLDEDDAVRGVIAIFTDLTETKRLEEKIRIADRMAAVGELSAAIAHEIRNPLAAISGSVEVLKLELQLQNENGRLLELIVKESNRLNEILADFLTYARNQRSSFNKVELCHLIADMFEVTRHHPSYHKDITLKLQAEDSIAYIYSDEDQLKQIIINLLVNACQAIGEKSGEITVGIDSPDINLISLTITDTGPGIPEEIMQKIFDPFYSTKKDGTGLGLAIVQRLSKLLEIDLWAKSADGGPTSFCLTFNKVPEMRNLPQSLEGIEA